MQNRSVWVLIGVGVLIVLLSALAHPLGLGHPGFGWKKTLGVVIGAVIIAAGLWRSGKPSR